MIRAKKYVEQHDKERIVISHFEILYDNVTEILGNPVDYKNFKTVQEQKRISSMERRGDCCNIFLLFFLIGKHS